MEARSKKLLSLYRQAKAVTRRVAEAGKNYKPTDIAHCIRAELEVINALHPAQTSPESASDAQYVTMARAAIDELMRTSDGAEAVKRIDAAMRRPS